MNPFIIKGYAGPEYFCDREAELKRLLSAVENQRNVTLVSLRKMGKTGLIFHLFGKLSKKKYDTLYVDIFDTANLPGFIDRFASALLALKKPFGEKLKSYIEAFRLVRPVITIDPMTGLPSASFKISTEEEAKHTLEDLFRIVGDRSRTKPLVIAFDEFQQIAKYPEKNTEALLRGITQNLHQVSMIFSGSNKSLLGQIFTHPTRPFYQSTELMYLDEIPDTKYADFISETFGRHQVSIDPGTIGLILRWTRVHTYYVQYCCNRLFELNARSIAPADAEAVFRNILIDHEPFYFEFRNLLTPLQWQLLKAIAAENGARNITSSAFIRNHDLTNPSTIKRGIESLIDKELIYKRGEEYLIQDLFFSRWLETKD